MAEDNALDDFLAGGQSDNGNSVSVQQIADRPKLKKVKRVKIRPALDVPQAPAKAMPIDMEASTLTQQSNNQQANVMPQEDQAVTSDFTNNSEIQNDDQNTALVTSSTAQNLSSTNIENPYVLEQLPPELDYAMGDDGAEEYIDSGNYVKKNIAYIIAFIFLFIGVLIGKMFFSEQKIENHGLEGVVANPDTPSGRPRCGLTDKNQACVFYILNWYKQELNGRDFYKLAAQLTGREEYMIESENMHYANVKIKPGHFAQLNIPALK